MVGHAGTKCSYIAAYVRCAGIERCARSSWQPDTVSMDVTGGRHVIVAFDPVEQELSEGMLWILINGKVYYLAAHKHCTLSVCLSVCLSHPSRRVCP